MVWQYLFETKLCIDIQVASLENDLVKEETISESDENDLFRRHREDNSKLSSSGRKKNPPDARLFPGNDNDFT